MTAFSSFRSVSYEMLKFALAYSPLFIGFMMMLMILFSEHPTFNLNFLGVFGKVILQKDTKIKRLQGVGDDDRGV